MEDGIVININKILSIESNRDLHTKMYPDNVPIFPRTRSDYINIGDVTEKDIEEQMKYCTHATKA